MMAVRMGIGGAPATLAVILLAGCAGTDSGGGGSAASVFAEPVDAISALVRGGDYPALVIEVDAVPGMALQPGVLQDLAGELDDVLDKPGGIDVAIDGALDPVGTDHAWTEEELRELGEESYDLSVEPGTVKVHVMLVDGHSENDVVENRVVGLAWDHAHVALFMDSIESVCTTSRFPPVLHDDLLPAGQYSILLHELGHIFGLVDLGLPMLEGHEDADFDGHCDNPECVMFHSFERQRALELLHERFVAGDMRPSSFDDACLSDVAALRDAP